MDTRPDMAMDMSRILQMANSSAGKKLIAMLQQKGGDELQAAIQKAAEGDYRQAQNTLQRILNNQEAAALIHQLQEE